jgi:hypothetical protein
MPLPSGQSDNPQYGDNAGGEPVNDVLQRQFDLRPLRATVIASAVPSCRLLLHSSRWERVTVAASEWLQELSKLEAAALLAAERR